MCLDRILKLFTKNTEKTENLSAPVEEHSKYIDTDTYKTSEHIAINMAPICLNLCLYAEKMMNAQNAHPGLTQFQELK